MDITDLRANIDGLKTTLSALDFQFAQLPQPPIPRATRTLGVSALTASVIRATEDEAGTEPCEKLISQTKRRFAEAREAVVKTAATLDLYRKAHAHLKDGSPLPDDGGEGQSLFTATRAVRLGAQAGFSVEAANLAAHLERQIERGEDLVEEQTGRLDKLSSAMAIGLHKNEIRYLEEIVARSNDLEASILDVLRLRGMVLQKKEALDILVGAHHTNYRKRKE